MKAKTILLFVATLLLLLFAGGFLVLFHPSRPLPTWVTLSEYVGGGGAIVAVLLALLLIIAYHLKVE